MEAVCGQGGAVKALIVVAHGSRRESSNNEVIALIEQLKTGMEDQYPIIMASFLELAAPSIREAILQCVDQGASHITLLPYFLSAGKHVHVDIPEQASKAIRDVRKVSINILPHLGSSKKMLDIMRGMVTLS